MMDEFVQIRTCRHRFQKQDNTRQQRGNDCPAGTLGIPIHGLQTICFKQIACLMQAILKPFWIIYFTNNCPCVIFDA